MEFFQIYWPVFLVALVIGIIVGLLVLRPKQNVRLSDSVPLRPHMNVEPQPHEGRSLADEAAAAASDIAGPILGAEIHAELPGAAGPADELMKLKGVGPKLAEMLNQRGIKTFEQIAKLSPGEVEALDDSLGAFRGRLTRDRVVEQADYLARGDIEGYRAKFGSL
jgi:predicted flap endonuclease-1-like 5' DNA nuclease